MLSLSFVGAPLEMTKRRWKELMKALYENHFDPRKDEEFKRSKIDIENKLPKILKLVKERRQNRKNRNAEAYFRKESELIELIEDFHKQYKFVYDQYDDIRGQLSRTVNGGKEDEGYFTASSSSDSDTESEKDVNKEDQLTPLTRAKKSLISEYLEAMAKVRENENIVQELKEKLDRQGKEISSLAQKQKLCQREISGLMKELESDLSSFNVKLDGACSRKRASGQQAENKGRENQVLKIEEIAKEMDEEMSQLIKNGIIEQDESVFEVPKIRGLIVQVNNLKLNLDCLINAEKSDSNVEKASQNDESSSNVHKNLQNQVNKMKRDLGSMRKKNTELESCIKKKSRENYEFQSQIDNLKKEVAIKTQELQKMQKAKEDSQMRVKNLELEAQNLCSQSSESEKLMAKNEQENIKLTQELETLQGKMVKMESMLKEQEDQFTELQKRLENKEDKSAQIVALTAQINHLEQELESKNEFERQIEIKSNDILKLTEEKESLQGRISELEKKLKDKGGEFSNLQNDMSTQIVALTKEVSQLQQEKDRKQKLDEQISYCDNEINELEEEKQSLQAKILELEITLTERDDEIACLQRKSQDWKDETSYLQEELSVERTKLPERLKELETHNNELRTKVSHQQYLLKQQEETINKLKGDRRMVQGRFLQVADRKINEMGEEFKKNFEDKLRILSRRIRVAEQVHAENKESWKRMKKDCEQNHPGIVNRMSSILRNEAEQKAVSQAFDEMMKGMECLMSDFESKEGSYIQRLSRLSDEIQTVKNCVHWTVDENKPSKNEPRGSTIEHKTDEKEQDKVMKEKVKRLEEKADKEKIDKLKLTREMSEIHNKIAELEKAIVEKDEGLLRLENEKVEAIRQLCMWVDYHQSRFDQLKEKIVKKAKGRGPA